jgi:hypothetical protein
LAQAKAEPGYRDCVAAKEHLEQEGRAEIERRVKEIIEGPNTLFVIDYSRIDTPSRIPMAFTPFGITAIDSERTIFSMTPFGAQIRSATAFQQSRPSPVLHDRRAKTFSFQLEERVSQDDVLRSLSKSEATGEPEQIRLLQLPGVSMNVGLARWRLEGQKLTLILEAEDR